MPLVSIITPAYNAENYLRETVDGVLSQTFTDWEMIIVNDGSTDGTAAVMESLQDDSRIRLVHQENGGVSSARNHGLRHATGKYIAFLDADDVWLPRFLEEGIGALENHGLDLVVQGQRMIGPKGEKVGGLYGDIYRAIRGTPAFPSDSHQLVAQLALGMSFAPCRVLMRRDMPCVREGFDLSLAGTEDTDLWIRAAIEGAKFGGIKQRNTLYRRHPESASQDIAKMEHNLTLLLEKSFSRADADEWFPQWLRNTAHGMIQAKMARKCYRTNRLEDWQRHIDNATTLISVPAGNSALTNRLAAVLIAVPGSEPILRNIRAGKHHILAARLAQKLKKMKKI